MTPGRTSETSQDPASSGVREAVGEAFVRYCRKFSANPWLEHFTEFLRGSVADASVTVVFRTEAGDEVYYSEKEPAPGSYWRVESGGASYLLPRPVNEARFQEVLGVLGTSPKPQTAVRPGALARCLPGRLDSRRDWWVLKEEGRLESGPRDDLKEVSSDAAATRTAKDVQPASPQDPQLPKAPTEGLQSVLARTIVPAPSAPASPKAADNISGGGGNRAVGGVPKAASSVPSAKVSSGQPPSSPLSKTRSSPAGGATPPVLAGPGTTSSTPPKSPEAKSVVRVTRPPNFRRLGGLGFAVLVILGIIWGASRARRETVSDGIVTAEEGAVEPGPEFRTAADGFDRLAPTGTVAQSGADPVRPVVQVREVTAETRGKAEEAASVSSPPTNLNATPALAALPQGNVDLGNGEDQRKAAAMWYQRVRELWERRDIAAASAAMNDSNLARFAPQLPAALSNGARLIAADVAKYRAAEKDTTQKTFEALRRSLGSFRASVIQAGRSGPGEIEAAYGKLREAHAQLSGQVSALGGDAAGMQRELDEIMDLLVNGEREGRLRHLRADVRAHDEDVRRFRGLSRSAASRNVSRLLAQNQQLLDRSRELGREADVIVTALEKLRATLSSTAIDR